MMRPSRIALFRRILYICIITSLIITLKHFLSIPSEDDELNNHYNAVYNLSDPFVMTNLIDQFLNSKEYKERDDLWSLLVQSWSKSFESYLKRTRSLCPSNDRFLDQYLPQYTKKLLLDNTDFQRRLTGVGLFFDYNPKQIRSINHSILPNFFHSSCTYFQLIVLIMKVQLRLFELNIDYFIGQNTLLGALRHHDIVPWHSIVEFNLPLDSKKKFLDNIRNRYQLVEKEIDEAYIDEEQIGYVYKISNGNQTWPQIEIYFYRESSTQIFDLKNKSGYLQKSDVYPLHLRPFGPILLFSMNRPQSMISIGTLNFCESSSWNHQLGEETDIDHQSRIPCEQLHTTYLFVQSRNSWRQGYCEETLKTKRVPYKSLSYFRYTCPENITYQLK